MSESQPGTIDLEAPDPPAAEPAKEPPKEPAKEPGAAQLQAQVVNEPAPDADDAALEQETVEIEQHGQTQQLVPRGAVKREREKYKQRANEEKARADRLEQLVTQQSQTLAALAGNPALAARVERIVPQSVQQAPPMPDDAAYEQLARSMELFDATGAPDIKRAKTIDAFYVGRMQPLVQQGIDNAVAPLRQQTAYDKAQANLGSLHQMAAQGKYSQQVLNQIANAVPQEVLANPEAAAMVHYMAVGLQAELDARAGVVKPAPVAAAPAVVPNAAQPLITESPVRRVADVQPSGLLGYVMREKGITLTKARELLGETPSLGTPLE
jgi:hypothetical protein